MTSKKSTKRALLCSALSLLLCFSMLVGTTFAWFTDSVSSARNTIQSGNLDVTLKYWDGDSFEDVLSTTKLFNDNAKWEPGHTEVVYLEIANAGSLALKYQLSVNVYAETVGKTVQDDDIVLSDHLVFKVIEIDAATVGTYTRDSAREKAGTEMGLESYYGATKNLEKNGDAHYVALVIYMPEEVGNDANHNGVNVPSIQLGVELAATQLNADDEKDSFNQNYDASAPIVTAPVERPATGSSLVLNSSAESSVSVQLPANVVDAIDNNVTAMSMAVSKPVVDTTANTVTFDSIELVDQNGDEIDLAGLNLSSKVAITLPVNGAFANGDQVAIYHDGELVTYVVVDNGYITYEVAHFCEVTVKKLENVAEEEKINLNTTPDENNVLVIDNVLQLMAFAKAVNAGNSYAGKTVILENTDAEIDYDLAGVSWEPIGNSTTAFQGTFDGNGAVIANLEVLMAGKSNVGFFGMTQNGEIKNLTFSNAKVVGRLNVGVVAGTPYTSKYTDITVTGLVEVDGMAYVGGVGGKNAYANWNNITVDVDDKSYVKANSVENGTAYRTYVGGVIGFMGEGGHTVSNVKSNIDVCGTTKDVGGIVGIAHYGNNFENVTCSGNVTVTNATNAANADEIGGIAGVWHNQNGTTVTFTNCKYTGQLSANVETVDLSNNSITGKAYDSSSNGTLIIDGVEYVAVDTADELATNLADGKNVILVNDIKM